MKRLTLLLIAVLSLTSIPVYGFTNHYGYQSVGPNWGSITCTETYRSDLESLDTYTYFDGNIMYLYGYDIIKRDLRTPLNRVYLALYATKFYRAALLDNSFRDNGEKFDDYQGKYSQYIKYSANVGVVKGFDNNTFRPEELVTKELAADTLYRIVNKAKATYPMTSKTIADASSITSGYNNQIQFLVDAGIMKLDASGNFNPKAGLTEEELLLIIKRAIDLSDMYQFNYTPEFFKTTKESKLTLDTLKTINKGEYIFTNVDLFFMFFDRAHKDIKGNTPTVSDSSLEPIQYFNDFANITTRLSRDHNSYTFSIGDNRNVPYSEYNMHKMRIILDDLSMLVSNAYGKDSPVYKEIMQAVLDTLDGKEIKTFTFGPIIDGHLERSITFNTNSSNAIRTRINIVFTEKQAPLAEIKSFTQIVPFDDAYLTFDALDIEYEDLETNLQKYPDILQRIWEERQYDYFGKYLNAYHYTGKDSFRHSSDFSPLSISAHKSADLYSYGFSLALDGLRFQQFTNKDVAEVLNRTSAYVYTVTSPKAHKAIMTDVIKHMKLMELTPNELKKYVPAFKNMDPKITQLSERIELDLSLLPTGTYNPSYSWSPTPVKQGIYFQIYAPKNSALFNKQTTDAEKEQFKTTPTDVKVKINSQLINTYAVKEDIHMFVDDLKYFGFDVVHNPYVEKIRIKTSTVSTGNMVEAIGPQVGYYTDSNHRVFLNNLQLDCVEINGKAAIKVDDLKLVKATSTWDGENRELLINLP